MRGKTHMLVKHITFTGLLFLATLACSLHSLQAEWFPSSEISRQEISRIVGCSREMAGRVLKTLETEGMISVAGKTIVVYPQEDREKED